MLSKLSLTSALAISISMSLLSSVFAQSVATKKIAIDDLFSSEKLDGRTLGRGDWLVADNKASVKFNEEKFKKHANHGALLSYETKLTNAEVQLRFTPKDYDSVIFTFDAAGGGHTFRITFRKDKPSNAVTYTTPAEGEKAKPIVLVTVLESLIEGKENELSIKIENENVEFSINGKSYKATHKQIARPKAITKLGIQHGDLTVSKMRITEL
jgi:hypothetical protein